MFYLKINDKLYEASFQGKTVDKDWDDRATKTINLEMSYTEAAELFHDDVKWYIYDEQEGEVQKMDDEGNPEFKREYLFDEEGNLLKDEEGNIQYIERPVMVKVDNSITYDNSEYSVLGDIVVHNNGTLSVKMGKLTDLEQAYEILYGE